MKTETALPIGVSAVIGFACLFDPVTRPIGAAVLVASAVGVVFVLQRVAFRSDDEPDKPDRWA